MSRYVSSKYDNGDVIKIILNELKMHSLEKPETLDSMAEGIDTYLYRENVKAYAEDIPTFSRSAKNLYSLVLGECTEILRKKNEGKRRLEENR